MKSFFAAILCIILHSKSNQKLKEMIIKKVLLITVVCLFIYSNLYAEEPNDSTVFKAHGKAYAKIFTNFHAGINKADDQTAFEVRRAYLGYKYYMTNEFSAEVKIDIGSANDELMDLNLGRHAYFKNAYVRYKKNGLQLNFGLIDMQAFLIQEKTWDHRYIWKSYQDRYKFGPKADLGANIIYKVSKTFSFDITASNGEGYKNLQMDNTIKGGAGVTLNFLKHFTARVYYDISVKSIAESTVAAFLSYKLKDKFSVSGEYNVQLNSHYHDNQNVGGVSFYSIYNFNPKFRVFGRYDLLASNTISGDTLNWNIEKDGSAVIAGVQYQIIKQLKSSLNFQGWLPEKSGKPELAYIFLNFEVKLN